MSVTCEKIVEKVSTTGLWCVRSGKFLGWARSGEGDALPMWWKDSGEEMLSASQSGRPRGALFWQKEAGAREFAVLTGSTPAIDCSIWHISASEVREWIDAAPCYLILDDGVYFRDESTNGDFDRIKAL